MGLGHKNKLIRRFTTKVSYGKPRDVIKELIKISDSKCIWCGIGVKQYYIKKELSKGQRYPYDMATIDHLIPRPFRKRGEISPKVLACNRCNEERGVMYNKYFHK